MPRASRIVIPGCPHHITQRGNNRQVEDAPWREVFFVEEDRTFYLDTLRQQCERFGLAVQAYCLMDNHVHLIGVPAGEESLAKAVGRTNLYYTRTINRVHGRSGHVWQDRFFSCPLDEEHFWSAVLYAERNPVRAKRVRSAWVYRWSSAAAHVKGEDATGLLDLAAWRDRVGGETDWRAELRKAQDGEMVERLRHWSNRGRPLGSDSWVSKLEVLLNRRLRPNPRGRPRKPRPGR